MDVLPTQRQNVELRVGELGSSDAVLGDEHVAAAVVVQNPAEMAGGEVVEVEVALVGEAPDPLARVEEGARAALPRAPAGVDVLPGCDRSRLLVGHRLRLPVGARR